MPASGSEPTTEAPPLWPERNWWLALLAILLLAGALRLTGYDFGLPFVEHNGVRAAESYYSLAAQMIIDQGTAKDLHLHNYPPGILSINYLALRFLHDPTAPPGTVIGGLRLLSVLASLAALFVVALLGYTVAGPLAGLIAAGLWAFTPTMVEFSRYATADIYLVLLTSLSLWLTLAGAFHKNRGWTTAATYVLMLAIIFKYTAIVIAPLVLFVPLVQGKRWASYVLGNCGRFALFCAWLVLLTPALEALQTDRADYQLASPWVQHVVIESLPGWTEFRAGLNTLLSELDLRLFLPGWLGLIFLIRGGAAAQRRLGILAIAAFILLWLLLIVFFNRPYIRFMLPAISMLIALAASGYALWWQFLQRKFVPFSPKRRRTLAMAALLVLLTLNLPNAWTAVEVARRQALPDRRNELARWADESLPASRYITNFDNRDTLNRDWGGYAGETRFAYAGHLFSDTSINEWRAQGALFAIVPYNRHERWREKGVNEFINETTLLKSYPSSNTYRDPGMVVLLLSPIQHEATGQLGPIRLIGYALGEESARPGHTFPFHLYWQASAPGATDYQVFNHLLDADGRLVAQVDGPPLPDPLLRRGTSNWDDPEEILYSREFALQLPENLASGEYSLVMGFYRRDNGQRLVTPTGEDSLWVTRIVVE